MKKNYFAGLVPLVFIRNVLKHSGPEMSDTYSKMNVEIARKAVERAIPALEE